VPVDKKSALHRLLLTDSRKLRALRIFDPFTQWWSITEVRFCVVCERPFMGRDIRFFGEDEFPTQFECPTPGCQGGFAEWKHPRLHL